MFLEIYKRTMVDSGGGKWSLDLGRDLLLHCMPFVLFYICYYQAHVLVFAIRNCFVKGKHEI